MEKLRVYAADNNRTVSGIVEEVMRNFLGLDQRSEIERTEIDRQPVKTGPASDTDEAGSLPIAENDARVTTESANERRARVLREASERNLTGGTWEPSGHKKPKRRSLSLISRMGRRPVMPVKSSFSIDFAEDERTGTVSELLVKSE